MSNLKLNKLKAGMKNGTWVTLNLPSNVAGHSNDETNFPHKLLLTNTQVSRICKDFAMVHQLIWNYQKLFPNIGQSGGFLSGFLGPLKTSLSLMKNVLRPAAKSVLIPAGLTAVSATDLAIQKNNFVSGMTALIISNEEINNIMKIIKSFKDAGLLIKGVSETIGNKAKE